MSFDRVIDKTIFFPANECYTDTIMYKNRLLFKIKLNINQKIYKNYVPQPNIANEIKQTEKTVDENLMVFVRQMIFGLRLFYCLKKIY